MEAEVAFGLQDTKQKIVPGELQEDGSLVFDFVLQVKAGRDSLRPAFPGRFASGTVDDRFVYLSWPSVPSGVWVNRVKARLGGVDWAMVREAQASDRPLVADRTVARRQTETGGMSAGVSRSGGGGQVAEEEGVRRRRVRRTSPVSESKLMMSAEAEVSPVQR
jgi:hypothetical protein